MKRLLSIVRVGGAWRSLRESELGVAAVEFAIVSPFLIMLLIGIVDLGRAFSTQASLHGALARTIEMAQGSSAENDYDYLVAEAATAAGVEEEDVTLTKWLECDGDEAEFDETCPAGEETARFIQIDIVSTYDPIFSDTIFDTNGQGLVELTVSDSLRIQ